VTADVREAAQQYSAKALKALVKMLDDPDSRVRATAAREILDRAHGKPAQALEHSGPEGAPLSEPQDDREIAKALAFMLSKAVRAQEDEDAKAGTLVLTPDDLAPLNPKPLPEAPTPGLEPDPQPARQWPTPDEQELLRAQRQEDRAFEQGNTPRVALLATAIRGLRQPLGAARTTARNGNYRVRVSLMIAIIHDWASYTS